ncbi:MAG: DUF4386 family protein [Streptosporangiaceae bacterium]
MLYVSCEALNPQGTDIQILNMADALKVLPIAARHPGQLYLSGSLSLLALGALAVSWAAIATLVRVRGTALATVAALLGGIGAFCGALVNVLVGVNLAAAATAPISDAAAGRFLVTTFNSGFEHVFMDVYLVGIYLAPVLIGIALWRSRSVPRWLAVLFAAGLELAQQVASAGPVKVVLLAARVWQMAAGPASHGDRPSHPAAGPANASAAVVAMRERADPGAAAYPGDQATVSQAGPSARGEAGLPGRLTAAE